MNDKSKLRQRLEALATSEDEDAETRAWALAVLEGRETIEAQPPKPPQLADGGARSASPPREESASERFNQMVRAAAGRGPQDGLAGFLEAEYQRHREGGA